MSLIGYLAYQLQHNQLAAAAVIAAPAAAVSYSIRNFPKLLWTKIKNQSVISVQLNSDQMIYREALLYITQNVIRERFTRSYVFSSKEHIVKDFHNSESKFELWLKAIKHRSIEVGYGRHIGFHRGHLVILDRQLEQNSQTEKFKETLTCSFIARSSDVIQRFKDDIDEFCRVQAEEDAGVMLAVNDGGSWTVQTKLRHRPIDTIFLPDNIPGRVLDHVKAFEARKEWSTQRGLPHHTGILLHGAPGNAKSSLIHAIASATKRRLFMLNLGAIKEDATWARLFADRQDWNGIILGIEDIDATGAHVQKREGIEVNSQKSVSLSTILNSLDGIASPDGLIVIATTNHIDYLDPALLRPGRFDLVVEIKDIGKPEFEGMATMLDIDPSTYSLPYFAPMSGATIRGLLLEGGVKSIEDYQKQNHIKEMSCDHMS